MGEIVPISGSSDVLDPRDPCQWVPVPGKIGTTIPPIVAHVVHQVRAMELGENDGFFEVLEAGLKREARTAAIYGSFADLVDAEMPIDITLAPRLRASVGLDPDSAGEEDYESWIEQRARTVLQLIPRGMNHLRRFPFNHFWDKKLWERLGFSQSALILMEDGLALLEAVLSKAPESEHEHLIAQALAARFAEDIVKAEIIEEPESVLVPDAGSVTPSRTEEMEELHRILSTFIAAAEGQGIKLYRDTLPISWSWIAKLKQEVAQGNDALLADLRTIAPACEEAIGFNTKGKVYQAMASILAKHFPSTLISKLTPATEGVPRTYQADWDWLSF